MSKVLPTPHSASRTITANCFSGLPLAEGGVDLFAFKGSSYLLLIDYYSRYVEMSMLHSTTPAAVIQHMKSIFAQHGIPEILISDNSPQFAAEIFAQFAQNFDFQHQTSSPNIPQGNGEIE